MMDHVLLITVLTILVTALIGTIIKYRLRDKCLRDFRGYLVTVEQLDGFRLWGELEVYHNGLVLHYPKPHPVPSGTHLETSALVYQSQYATLRALRRYHDELSPENQARRRREISRTYHPHLGRRLWRKMRNLFNLLRDAVGQAFSLMIGAVKKAGASVLLTTQEARITSTAQQAINQGAAAYEPMLENYIGRNVVLEVMHNGKAKNNFGILKEYSDAFISVLDVQVREEHAFSLAVAEQLRLNQDFDFELQFSESPAGTGTLKVAFTNKSRKRVEVVRAEMEGYQRTLDLPVQEGATVKFTLDDLPLPVMEESMENECEGAPIREPGIPPLQVWVHGLRNMDIIVPRSIGAVRHGAIPAHGPEG